ncbi:MAG: VOC family protein [Actinomycetota bacterium]|nr:VOC family protein [Actinomycetota bacterium]
MVRRSALSHVALGVRDVAVATRFYREVFGLQPHATREDGSYLLGHGAGHHVLELHEGTGTHHFGVEVRGTSLNDVAADLHDRGVRVHEGAAGGLPTLWVQDPDGNSVELHGPIDRSGERTTDGAARPQRIDHITFGSPQVEAMVTFYVGALGMRVSDRMEDDFVWLRGDHHHHDVAIVKAPVAGLDHYSYEICSWKNVRIWCDRFAASGIPLTWGPGRHGPGNNVFLFVDDSDGHHIELSCEMELLWDEHVEYAPDARVWARSPAIGNLWGPLPTWRKDLTAEAEQATQGGVR